MSVQDENQKNDTPDTKTPEAEPGPEQGEETLSSVTEIHTEDDVGQQLEAVKKEFLYLRAEFENYKRNAIKERSQLVRYGSQRLALDLLDTLDVFSQAFENEIDGENFQQFVDGIRMTQEKLLQTLEKHGVTEVPSIGENFNPEVHEALGTEDREGFEAGQICRVFKAPYKYHEKLLRAGQVFVAQGPQESPESPS